MPIYSVRGPDGRIYDVEGPAGASEAQIIAAVKQQIAAQPKPKEGLGAAFGKGIESLLSATRTGVKGIYAPEEAAREGRAREEDIQRRYAEQVSLDKVKQAYEQRGLLSAAGEVASQIPAALAEQAPNIAATLGSARLGAMAGAPFGVPGAIVGGLAGAVVPSLFQQAGSNIQRQAAEGQPISRAAAYGAAVPQAALDVASTFIPLGRTLVGKALGPGVANLLERGAAEGAEKLAKETLLKTLGKGTAVGALAEIPTEVTQQMLERLQAGLPVLSEDALKEYGETAYQTSLLAPIGAAGRVAERGAARERIEAREELQREQATRAKRAQERAAEAQKQTPEYAATFMQQHEALQKEYDDLGALLKQKLPPGSSFAAKQTFEDQKKRRKELKEELEKQAPEYNRVKQLIPAAPSEEEQRLAALTPLEYQMEQAGVDLTAPVAEQRVFTGEEDFAPPIPAPVQYAQSRIALANDQALVDEMEPSERPAFYVAYLMKDPAMAKALVAGDVAIPGLKKRESNAVLGGLKLQLKALEAQTAAAEAEQKAKEAARAAQQEQARKAFEAAPAMQQDIAGFQRSMGDVVPQREFEFTPQVNELLDRMAVETPYSQNAAFTGMVQQLKAAPVTLQLDKLNAKIRETETQIAETGGTDADKTQLANMQKAKGTLEKLVYRKLFDLAEQTGQDDLLKRVDTFKPTGEARRAKGEFQLFGEAETTPREITREVLQERLTRAMASNKLSDDAYEFLSRVEATLPEKDRAVGERGATEGLKPGVRYTSAGTTPSYAFSKDRKEAKISYPARLDDNTEVTVEILRSADKNGRLSKDVSDVRIREGTKPPVNLGKQGVQTDEQILQMLVDIDTVASVQKPKAVRPEGRVAPQSLYELIDQQLQRIESGAEGMAREGKGRKTTLQAFPAEGRADVTGATLANAEDMARQYLFQQKVAEGMKPMQARELAFKATVAELAEAADATRPDLARTLREGTAAVTKRPARDIGKKTLRGPSAKAAPLSLQEELEPFIQQIERAREEDMGQMALFPSEQKKLAITRATPEEFQQYLRSDKVQRLRKNFEPATQRLARARTKLEALTSRIDELNDAVVEIESAQAVAFPAQEIARARRELTALEARPKLKTGEVIEGLADRIAALREVIRVGEAQEAKLKAAKERVERGELKSMREELADVQRQFGSILSAVARRGQLRAAVIELNVPRNLSEEFRSEEGFIKKFNISDADKALLLEQLNAKADDTAIGKHRKALEKQIADIDNALARVDAVARVADAELRVRDYETRSLPPEADDRVVLAAAKRELRAAKSAASSLIKKIGDIAGKTAAQEAAERRAKNAVDKARAEIERTKKYVAAQAALERQQRAPEGVDASGQPLRSMVYEPITDAQRAAREDDTPTVLVDEMRQVRGNPQQVLKGYRAYISTITKKLREAYDKARQQTVEGVKERAPYEAALAAYRSTIASESPELRALETERRELIDKANKDIKDPVARAQEYDRINADINERRNALPGSKNVGRANLEPRLARLEKTYNDAVTNALNARVMPKGLVGYQSALTEMLRREAWLSKLIADGTVEVAEPPKPRKRKTEAELQEIQDVLNEKEIKEAATRDGAPEIDVLTKTKTDIEQERKAKKTRYSAKGVGQETAISAEALKLKKERQILLKTAMTPAEKARDAELKIIEQALEKQARKEPLTELEQLLLDDYRRSRKPIKESEVSRAAKEAEVESEEKTSEELAEEARAREAADFDAQEVAETGVIKTGVAEIDSLFGAGREAKDRYREEVDQEIRTAGTSTLARFAARRKRLADVDSQLAFIEANKNGPVVNGQPTLSEKQAAAKAALTAERETLQKDVDTLTEKLKKLKTAKPADTLEQLAATASQGPALKEEVDTEESAAAVANNLSETGSTEIARAVSERLKLLLGNTRVEIVDDLRDPDGQAAYGQAAADGSFIRLDSRYGLNERTFIHEGVHAATERVIQMPEDQLTPDQLRAKRELEELFDAYKKLPNATNENAKASLSEFASEALSDDMMQAEMRAQKWTLRHMWDSFKSAILRMLGVKTPENMLDATLAAVDNLMTKVPRPTAADNALLSPKVLNRPVNLNPALVEADAVARQMVAGNQSWWQTVRAKSTGLAMETALVDRFASFERLAKYMPKLQGAQMMYYLRMYDQRMNFVAQSVANGALDIREVERRDGEPEFLVESVKGPSLKEVVQTLKRATSMVGDPNATSRLFTQYLAARRAERVGFDKLNLREPELTAQKLRETVAQIKAVPGLQEIFDDARDTYNEYNQNLVRFAQKAGVFTQAEADMLLKDKDYIPWYRDRNGVAELAIGGLEPIKLGNIKDMPHLQELVGGDKPILDFTISSVQNTNTLVDMSLRNLATRNAMLELLDLGLAKVTPKPVDGTNVVRFKIKGDDRYAILDTETIEVNGKKIETGVPAEVLVKGMEGIPVQTTGLMRAMTIPTQFLRRAVTLNPLYMVRQLMRDSLAATIATGADFIPVLGALKEINSATKSTLEKRGITGGQVFTGGVEDLSKVMRDLIKGETAIGKTIGAVEWMGMEADALTRRAQYNSYIKQGMSEMEATLLALESMNFNKRGAAPLVHTANALLPFFNAQIQGLNVLYKAMFGQITPAERVKIRQKLFTRGAMLMAATLAYAHSMQDDEAYKNALPAEKYNNWFVRLPFFDEPVRIPIPFEIGYIFKALPEAIYNTIVNERGAEEAKEALLGILRNVIPGGSSYFIPQAMKPALEVLTNYSMFTERPMMSAKEQGLLPEYQYRDSTTQLAKLFGGALGVSPIKIDALVNGYFSTMGMAAMQLASLPIPAGDTPEKATRRMSELPVVGSAFQPNDARWIINSTYDALEDARKTQASYKELVNRGEKAEARTLLDRRASDFAQAQLAGYYRQQMGLITQYEGAVRASDKTPDEKRALLDKARQMKIKLSNLARQASDAAKLRQEV